MSVGSPIVLRNEGIIKMPNRTIRIVKKINKIGIGIRMEMEACIEIAENNLQKVQKRCKIYSVKVDNDLIYVTIYRSSVIAE